MTAQPTPPTPHTPPTPPADMTQATDTTQGERPVDADTRPRPRPRTAGELSDAQAVSLMRRWVEEFQQDPAQHSYFPSIVRVIFKMLKDEAAREALRAADPAPTRPQSYEVQPVGIPDLADVTLDTDDAYRVFLTLLDAIKAWDYNEDPLKDYAARERLDDLLGALRIMNDGYMAAILPGVQAHRDDAAAAREWQHDRWVARGRLEQEARMAATQAQERQRDAGDGGAQDHADTPAAPASPPAAHAS